MTKLFAPPLRHTSQYFVPTIPISHYAFLPGPEANSQRMQRSWLNGRKTPRLKNSPHFSDTLLTGNWDRRLPTSLDGTGLTTKERRRLSKSYLPNNAARWKESFPEDCLGSSPP